MRKAPRVEALRRGSMLDKGARVRDAAVINPATYGLRRNRPQSVDVTLSRPSAQLHTNLEIEKIISSVRVV